MHKKLPPLKALRAFEAAARHLSIKDAAAELCVTPGAVSQLVRALEEQLGTPLFERTVRAIRLTDAGRAYHPPVRNAFRQIAEATNRLAASVDTGILTLSVTPFFAGSWLVPRLKTFRDRHPEIDLQVQATSRVVDLAREGVDVAIRHGLGRYPGLASDLVLAVAVVPAAAAALAQARGLPKTVGDLARWPLVHDAERKGWQAWFAAQGLVEIGPPRGPSYDDSALLLEAVRAGQGAGLLPAAFVAPEIEAGRLVALSAAELVNEIAYYLVYPEAARDRPKVAAFREWILAEAATSSDAWPIVRRATEPALSARPGRRRSRHR